MSMCDAPAAPIPGSCARRGCEHGSCGREMAGRQCRVNDFSQRVRKRAMDFNMSDRQKEWLGRVQSFMTKHVRPAVPVYRQQDEAGERWKVIPVVEELKKKARAEGLWNMFMPPSSHEDDEFRGAGLTNLEYAPLAEEMGHIGAYSRLVS